MYINSQRGHNFEVTVHLRNSNFKWHITLHLRTSRIDHLAVHFGLLRATSTHNHMMQLTHLTKSIPPSTMSPYTGIFASHTQQHSAQVGIGVPRSSGFRIGTGLIHVEFTRQAQRAVLNLGGISKELVRHTSHLLLKIKLHALQ